MESGDIVSILLGLLGLGYIIFNVLTELARDKKTGKRPARDKSDEETFEEFVASVERNFPVRRQEEALPPPMPSSPAASPSREQKATSLRMMRGSDKKFEFRSNLESYTQKTSIDDRGLQIHLRKADEIVSEDLRIQQSEGVLYKVAKTSPIQARISSLPSRSLLVISHELMRDPVAFRRSPFPRDV